MSNLEDDVRALRVEVAELRNEMSLLNSVQRVLISVEERLVKLETSYQELLSHINGRTVIGARTYKPGGWALAPFGSGEKLEEWVETAFKCSQGDPRAYHFVWDTNSNSYGNHKYEVLGLIAPANLPEAAEHLRQALYVCLFKLKASTKQEKPTLYWRRHIEESEEEGRHKISIRIAIPGADYNVALGMLVRDGEPYPVMRI